MLNKYTSKLEHTINKKIFKKYNMYNSSIKSSIKSFVNIQNYYDLLSDNKTRTTYQHISCFAVNIAIFLSAKMKTTGIELTDGAVPDSLFSLWASQLTATELSSDFENDIELCIIYLKQMLHIMKSALLIQYTDDYVSLSSNFSYNNLYEKLFMAFWYKTSWKKIFPSSEYEAAHLEANREKICSLLQKYPRRDITSFYNEYSLYTGHNSQNELFSISFIDFYLITWLKHFNIVTYTESIDSRVFTPVTINVTDTGKGILDRLYKQIL